jgi:hypothetical protein
MNNGYEMDHHVALDSCGMKRLRSALTDLRKREITFVERVEVQRWNRNITEAKKQCGS